MDKFFSLLYGLSLILLSYWISYLSVRGLLGNGTAPFYLVLGKFFIYWKVITWGFGYFLPAWILLGMVGGTCLSLPAGYLLNKKREENDQSPANPSLESQRL